MTIDNDSGRRIRGGVAARVIAVMALVVALVAPLGGALSTASPAGAAPTSTIQFFDYCKAASNPTWCTAPGIYQLQYPTPAGTNPTLLLGGGAGYTSRWSADGSKMVYEFGSYMNPGPFDFLSVLGLGVRTAAGATQTIVADQNATDPAISPDGSEVVYTSTGDTMWIVSTSGGSPTELQASNGISLLPLCGDEAFWASNNTIVFSQCLAPGGNELFAFPAPTLTAPYPAKTTVTNQQVNVTLPTTGTNSVGGYPSASPDGSTYYFSAEVGGTNGLWSVPAAGGSPTLVANGPDATVISNPQVQGTQLLWYDEFANNNQGASFVCTLGPLPCNGSGGSIEPSDPNSEFDAVWAPAPKAVTVTGVVATGVTGPATGAITGGTAITVTGSGFGNAGATDQVNLVPPGGGTAIPATSVVVQNDTTLTAVTGDATAALPGGQHSLATDVAVTAAGVTSPANPTADQFTYSDLAVTSVTPTSGPVAGLGQMTIAGHGFTGATAVNFLVNGSAAETVPLTGTGVTVTDTAITFATAPNLTIAVNSAGANSDATVDVQVSVPKTGGTELSPVTSLDKYTAKVPVVTGVFSGTFSATQVGPDNVSGGPAVGGEAVTALGSGFTGVTEVNFSAPSTSTLSPSVACSTAPPPVSASNPCIVRSDTKIEFWAPDATSLLAASGDPNSPLTADTIVSIPVSNNALQSVTSSPAAAGANDPFVLVPIRIDSLSVTSGPAVGGDDVTVTGAGLSTATIVLQNSGILLSSGTTADTVTANAGATATSLTFKVPDETSAVQHNSTRNVAVTVAARVTVPTSSGGSVTVTSAPAADQYTIVAPAVTKVTVIGGGDVATTSGPVTGGTTIDIAGQGFTGSTQVDFVDSALNLSQVTATNGVVSSDGTLLTVVTPNASAYGAGGSTTDVEVQIPVDGNNSNLISSPPNSPADTFTFGTAGPAAPPCGTLNNCQGATNSDPNGSAVAASTSTTGTITATGTGVGGITVGRYPADPVGTPAFTVAGTYFDVRVSNPNSFTAATINDCDLQGGTTLEWWNPAANAGAGAWQPVTPAALTAGPPPCITVAVNATSSPSLAQLTGTVFAAVAPPVTDPNAVSATKSTIVASPTSVLADGSHASTITVTLLNGNGKPVSGKVVTLTQGAAHSKIAAVSATSNHSGQATLSVTDTTAEPVSYTAVDKTDNITLAATAKVTFTAVPAHVSTTKSTVVAAPTSVPADGTHASTVTVTLLDANGKPVAGRSVALSQGKAHSKIGGGSAITNQVGQVAFTVTDTTAETATYSATDTTDALTIVDTATVSFTNAPHVSGPLSFVLAVPASVPADGSHASIVVVTLVDTNGRLVAGKTVTLSQGGGHSKITTVSGVTNQLGVAVFTVTDTTAETVTYAASDKTDALQLSDTASVTFSRRRG